MELLRTALRAVSGPIPTVCRPGARSRLGTEEHTTAAPPRVDCLKRPFASVGSHDLGVHLPGECLNRLGQLGIPSQERLEVVGVPLGMDGDLGGDRIDRLAATGRAAAWMPASMERERFSRMKG